MGGGNETVSGLPRYHQDTVIILVFGKCKSHRHDLIESYRFLPKVWQACYRCSSKAARSRFEKYVDVPKQLLPRRAHSAFAAVSPWILEVPEIVAPAQCLRAYVFHIPPDPLAQFWLLQELH